MRIYIYIYLHDINFMQNYRLVFYFSSLVGLAFVVKHYVKCRLQVFELYPITPIAVWLLLGNGIAYIVNSMEMHGSYISSDQWCFMSADYLSRCKKRCAKNITRVHNAVMLSLFHVTPIANPITGKLRMQLSSIWSLTFQWCEGQCDSDYIDE